MTLFSNIPRLKSLDLTERRVFVRADLDVELSSFGGIVDDAPLRAALPTLRTLLAARAKVIVGASFDQAHEPPPRNAASCIARRLGELLGVRSGVLGRNFPAEIAWLEPGALVLTPNLLEQPEEQADDWEFARRIARSIDVYVGDGLRAAQHSWASTSTLPRLVPARGAGEQLGRSLDMIELLSNPKPERPYTAVVGGDSFARKARLLWALLLRVDHVLLGGAVANTCLAAQGWQPGASRYEAEQLEAARSFMETAQAQGITVHLPVDAVTMQRQVGLSSTERRLIHEVPPNEAVVDLGLETSLAYAEILRASSTVVWNGLMGMGEVDELCGGTYRVGQAATITALRSAVFGKRTVAVGERLDIMAPFKLVSVGGDAALSMMGGTVLPGVEALRVAMT